MRLRLLRRRLTISAPRMAIRSALPWPFRWLLGAVVLGFSAALALWAFELGKNIAGLDDGARLELQQLQADNRELREALERNQASGTMADSLLIAERAAQERLVQQIKALEEENRTLKSDLGFFEQLIPTAGPDSLNIRGLQTERLSDTQVKWQVLVIQAVRNASEFQGTLELSFTGELAGKPWNHSLPGATVRVGQYLRLDGVVDVPPQAMLKTVTARLVQGGRVKSSHTQKL